ncbi:MAG: hypothetical protein DMF25_01405 [Verrucomicrobia bacterium]|nr:MAG: hypothetical protein DMF25_01405 [Verrucomicrobiota bacterium]
MNEGVAGHLESVLATKKISQIYHAKGPNAVIPNEVEESRRETLEVTPRDLSTSLKMTAFSRETMLASLTPRC